MTECGHFSIHISREEGRVPRLQVVQNSRDRYKCKRHGLAIKIARHAGTMKSQSIALAKLHNTIGDPSLLCWNI